MATFFRFSIIALTLAAIVLGITGLLGTNHAASTRMLSRTQRISVDQARVVFVPRASADEKAGLRAGDILDLRPDHFRNYAFLRAGQVRDLAVMRGTRRFIVHYNLGPETATDPLDRGAAGFLMVLISALVGAFVGLRGGHRADARMLSLFLIGAALAPVMGWQSIVAPTNYATYAWNAVANYLVFAFLNYALIVLGTEFPPVHSRLRSWLRRSAIPLTVFCLLATAWSDLRLFTPSVPFALVTFNHISLSVFVWLFLANIVVTCVCIAGCLAGLAKIDEEHRAQMQWMAALLIVTCLAWIVPTAAQLFAPDWDLPGAAWIVLLQDTLLLALPYVILRHRLVDLSVVVSRAAIFTTVSILIVSAFIVGEWSMGKIAEKSLPGGEKSLAGQLMVLAIALAIGLSARTIHAQVDRRLNAVFFARRARALANLRQFAEETEVIVKSSALLSLFHQTLAANTEAAFTAVYLRDGSTFVLNHSSAGNVPQGVDEDDPAIVQMRRWREPFEFKRGDHPFSEALLVPMSVRGTLAGFVVCGPKRERTHYAGDEVEAIAQAAHRATISYVLLSHPTISAPAPFGAVSPL